MPVSHTDPKRKNKHKGPKSINKLAGSKLSRQLKRGTKGLTTHFGLSINAK